MKQVIPVVIYCPEQGSNTTMPSTSVLMTLIRGLWTDLWLEKPLECFCGQKFATNSFGNYFSTTSEKRNIHKMNLSHSCSWQVLFNVILWALIPSAVRCIAKYHSALLFNIPNELYVLFMNGFRKQTINKPTCHTSDISFLIIIIKFFSIKSWQCYWWL